MATPCAVSIVLEAASILQSENEFRIRRPNSRGGWVYWRFLYNPETGPFMATQNPAAHGPSPALVFDLLQAHQRTAALRAAIELDLFRAIGECLGDVSSLA